MGLLSGLILLIVSISTLLARLVPRGAGRPLRPLLLGQAVLFLAVSGYLALFVAAEDGYRNDGTSRWDAYDAHGLTVMAIAVGVLVGLLAIIALRSSRLALLSGAAGVVAACLVTAAFLANSLN